MVRPTVLALVLLLALVTAGTSLTSAYGQESEVTMIVTYTENQGARLRESASTTASVVTVIPEGTRVQASTEVTRADGRTWRKVRDADGHSGYVVVDFLANLDEVYAVPTNTPVPQVQVSQQPQAIPTPLPCPDIYTLFPEWRDPEGAVQLVASQSMRDRGFNPYVANPFIKKMVEAYAVPPDDAVAGWIGHSIYHATRGNLPEIMTLRQYVDRQQQYRMALGSLRRSDYLGAVLTREQWTEMLSWTADTCSGMLLRNPENTRLVRLMGQSVGDTAWLQRVP